MGKHQRTLEGLTDNVPLLLRLQSLSDPSVSNYIAKTKAKYGKHLLPIEEVRRVVDESMGEKTLTDILNQMRETQP
ncbi:MAG: hypothetical protein Q7O66_01260 [Dehalococcoidia bacterium]|nr:hypothetical protein [Dehalococcoidia bacterium]